MVLQWWHSLDQSGSNPADAQRVEVSTDGTTWTSVYLQPDGVDEIAALKEIDISDYVGLPEVRIRFVYADGGGLDNGWYVDDVRVVAW